jgi:hypothetical protein
MLVLLRCARPSYVCYILRNHVLAHETVPRSRAVIAVGLNRPAAGAPGGSG